MDTVTSVVDMLVSVGIAALVAGAMRYQRCPHCHRLVRRAHGTWMTCARCGRKYSQGIHRV